MKAMSTPTGTAPASDRKPPYQKTVMMATTPRNSTAGIEEREGQNGVLVGFHVHAVEVGELVAGFSLAVEKLHDAHAADVFLQEGVDARDGRADAAIGVADLVAEEPGGHEDEGHDGEGGQRQPPVHPQHDDDEDHQQEGVVDHRGDARGEEVVERVHVGGHARDQAAHGAAVVEAHRQALQVLEDLLAQVVHGVLADLLHHADLQVLEGEAQRQRRQEQQRHPAQAADARGTRNVMVQSGHDVAVHGDFEQPGPRRRQRRHRQA